MKGQKKPVAGCAICALPVAHYERWDNLDGKEPVRMLRPHRHTTPKEDSPWESEVCKAVGQWFRASELLILEDPE